MAQATGWSAKLKAHREKFGVRAAVELFLDRVLARAIRFNIEKVVWLDVDRTSTRRSSSRPASTTASSPSTTCAASPPIPENCIGPEFIWRTEQGLDKCFAAIDEKTGRLAGYGWYALECIEGDHCMGTAL